MSKYVIGVDMGIKNGDKTLYQVWKKPSILRLFLRRIGLDKSRWELELVDKWIEEPES